MRGADGDAGQVVESSGVRGDDCAVSGDGGRSDDQIVGASRAARPSGVGQEGRMCPRHIVVVVLDDDVGDEILDERQAAAASPLVGQLHADEELGCGDGGDDNVIVVSKEKIDIPLAALDGNENGRIENQAGQDRSSATRS